MLQYILIFIPVNSKYLSNYTFTIFKYLNKNEILLICFLHCIEDIKHNDGKFFADIESQNSLGGKKR